MTPNNNKHEQELKKKNLPLSDTTSECVPLKDIPENMLAYMNQINRELNYMSRPRTIAVCGDDGIGKTFVINQLAHHINELPSVVKNRMVKFITNETANMMFADEGVITRNGHTVINAINKSNNDHHLIIVTDDFHVAAALSIKCPQTSFIVEMSNDDLQHAIDNHVTELNKMSVVMMNNDMKFSDMLHELKHVNIRFAKAYKMKAIPDASVRAFVRSLHAIATSALTLDDDSETGLKPSDTVALPIGYVIDSLEYAYARSLEEPYAGKVITSKAAKEIAAEAFKQEPYLPDDLVVDDYDDDDPLTVILNDELQKTAKNGKNKPKDKPMKYRDPLHLADRLKKEVINQDKAIDMVSRAILIDAAKLKPTNKPVASFLFLGPSGVGKTQLAKSLADNLFDKPANFVRIDCSELSEKHTVSRLFGTTPGYVGFEAGGELTNAVREHPQSVVLLDEVEKAHADIWNTFLQVFDDARLTDGSGKTTDFSHCVFIMTGNLGTKEAEKKAVGFGELNEVDEKSAYAKATKDFFRPEFLNRLDGICYFNKLRRKDYIQIMQLKLNDISSIISKNYGKTVDFIMTPTAIDDILRKAKSLNHGAREIEQVLKKNVVLPMAEKILSSDISFDNDANITISDNNGDITLQMNAVNNAEKD